MKALLTDAGLKIWGYAFPAAEIPVKSAVPFHAFLVGPFNGLVYEEPVYLVDWAALTQEQRDLLLKHFMEKDGATRGQVEKEILDKGLPLRAKYVSSVVIPAMSF